LFSALGEQANSIYLLPFFNLFSSNNKTRTFVNDFCKKRIHKEIENLNLMQLKGLG